MSTSKAPRGKGATLLTFRLDKETRERVRARLKRDGDTLSAVVTRGLRDYVAAARSAASSRGSAPSSRGSAAPAGSSPRDPAVSRVRELPEHVVAWLRDLRLAGRSQALSAALAELHERGWPLERLAQALGVSKQAVQARVRRSGRTPGASASGPPGAPGASGASGPPTPGAPGPGASESSSLAAFVPAVVRRRPPAADARPHFTVRIDQGLRAAAHRVAADDGRTLTQVVEAILDHYLRRGLISPSNTSDPATPPSLASSPDAAPAPPTPPTLDDPARSR